MMVATAIINGLLLAFASVSGCPSLKRSCKMGRIGMMVATAIINGLLLAFASVSGCPSLKRSCKMGRIWMMVATAIINGLLPGPCFCFWMPFFEEKLQKYLFLTGIALKRGVTLRSISLL